jgi:hypothetical protein
MAKSGEIARSRVCVPNVRVAGDDSDTSTSVAALRVRARDSLTTRADGQSSFNTYETHVWNAAVDDEVCMCVREYACLTCMPVCVRARVQVFWTHTVRLADGTSQTMRIELESRDYMDEL